MEAPLFDIVYQKPNTLLGALESNLQSYLILLGLARTVYGHRIYKVLHSNLTVYTVSIYGSGQPYILPIITNNYLIAKEPMYQYGTTEKTFIIEIKTCVRCYLRICCESFFFKEIFRCYKLQMGCCYSSLEIHSFVPEQESDVPEQGSDTQTQNREREWQVREDEERQQVEEVALDELYEGFMMRCCEVRPGAYCQTHVFNAAFDRYVSFLLSDTRTDDDLLMRLPTRRPIRRNLSEYAHDNVIMVGVRVVAFALPQDTPLSPPCTIAKNNKEAIT